MALQIKLTGCQTKGHFTAKSGNNAFLAVKWPFHSAHNSQQPYDEMHQGH